MTIDDLRTEDNNGCCIRSCSLSLLWFFFLDFFRRRGPLVSFALFVTAIELIAPFAIE